MATASVEKLTTTAKDGVAALSNSGSAAVDGLGTLAKAYQDLTTRNAQKFNESIKALFSVKTPEEFFTLQQKLVKESVDTAVSDSRAITELTTSIFTAMFQPVQKQAEAFQTMGKA